MIKIYKLRKMVLEVIALINVVNKLINEGDVFKDFTLVDKSSVPQCYWCLQPENVYIYGRG